MLCCWYSGTNIHEFNFFTIDHGAERTLRLSMSTLKLIQRKVVNQIGETFWFIKIFSIIQVRKSRNWARRTRWSFGNKLNPLIVIDLEGNLIEICFNHCVHLTNLLFVKLISPTLGTFYWFNTAFQFMRDQFIILVYLVNLSTRVSAQKGESSAR